MHLRNVLPAVLLLWACGSAETPDQAAARISAESAAARTAIDEINVRYARYLNGNHADSVALLFAEDGVMMPPFTPAIEGRDAIRSFLSANGMPPGATLSFQSVSVLANGADAIERGTSSFTLPATGGAPAVSVPGKYLVHWHKVGDQWLQKATIWSDDVPPPPAS